MHVLLLLLLLLLLRSVGIKVYQLAVPGLFGFNLLVQLALAARLGCLPRSSAHHSIPAG